MNDSDLKVSIITVSFNSEKTIKDTLDSVLNQSYNNIEYIVIDGKSLDSTKEILKEYQSKFKENNIDYTWISEKDKGIYDAMNKGIVKSTGQLVGIINSDDWYESDAIEKVVNYYKKYNFDMFYANLRIINENRSYIKKAKLRKIVSTRYWNHPTTFVKRQVYDKFNYQCKYIFDDLDFMLKIRKNNYSVKIMNEVLANFRLGGVSNNKNLKKLFQDIAIRNKIYLDNGYSKFYFLDNLFIEMFKFVTSKIKKFF